MTVPMLPSPCGGRSSRPSKGDGTRTSFSIPVMLRLERAFRLDADIFGLIRSQLCQLDADLGEMQPCHFFIERLREHVDRSEERRVGNEWRGGGARREW